ncbi:hypothetical protein [Bacillus salipaludis]|uniref:Uncharacterized protein n=1 Tax=Bacillus salipaludis TaxID=2547811 RepID=A0ABW8RA15_9BACI
MYERDEYYYPKLISSNGKETEEGTIEVIEHNAWGKGFIGAEKGGYYIIDFPDIGEIKEININSKLIRKV